MQVTGGRASSGLSGAASARGEEEITGLREVLRAAKLSEREADAVAWFREQGIESIAELKDAEIEAEFAQALRLKPSKAKIFLKRIAESTTAAPAPPGAHEMGTGGSGCGSGSAAATPTAVSGRI